MNTLFSRVPLVAGVLSGLLLSACTPGTAAMDPERPAGPDLTLKAGYYEIQANQGSRTVHRDLAVVPERQKSAFFHNEIGFGYLRVLQDDLKPEYGAGSYQASDYPCEVTDFENEGGSFTAKGKCTVVSRDEVTDFDYRGKAYGDAFDIVVTRSGRGTIEAGKPDEFKVTGKWSKEVRE